MRSDTTNIGTVTKDAFVSKSVEPAVAPDKNHGVVLYTNMACYRSLTGEFTVALFLSSVPYRVNHTLEKTDRKPYIDAGTLGVCDGTKEHPQIFCKKVFDELYSEDKYYQ